jgi:hypothetical protein
MQIATKKQYLAMIEDSGRADSCGNLGAAPFSLGMLLLFTSQ